METLTLDKQVTNADLVRRGYEAFNNADLATLSSLFHDDCTWHTPGKTSIGGSRKGKAAVFSQFGRYASETHGSFKAHLKSVAAAGDDCVVGIHVNTGERNGRKIELDCCIVFEFRDGQVISGREYFFDLHAWDAFWS
jgi:ketosteroid isomerase-like protein